METCVVSPGEFRVVTGASPILQTNLGSCVVVCLFDCNAHISGLIHILLPQGPPKKEALSPARYARTGIPLLISEMVKLGASKENIVAEIAGGALIWTGRKLSVDLNIGRRNSDMAQKILTREGIPIIKKALGGYRGRVLTLEPGTGQTYIRYVGKQEREDGLPVEIKKLRLDDFKTKIESLRPVPNNARRVISRLEFSEYCPDNLENFVLKDQAICANVLKMCNSAQPGFSHDIQTIPRAAALLGSDILKNIIRAACTYKLHEEAPQGYSTKEGYLSRHAICCAMVAELTARQKRFRDPRVFYTAGLLHDIGKLVLDQYAFENFNLVMDKVTNEAKTFIEAEKEILGYNHAQVGGIVAMEWGLPPVFVEAISFHHRPEKAIENSEVASVVHVADIICAMFGAGSSASIPAGQPSQHALSTIDLRSEDVDAIIEHLPDVIKEVDAI